MNTRSQIVSISLLLLIVLTSCTVSINVELTPSSSDQVATVVALTMQAPPPVANTPAVNTLEPSAIIIPQPIYFLAKDSQSLTQVFRIAQDGKTITQLTSELVNVLDYAVAMNGDGSLAYEIDNQLILVDANGSNRRVLAQGSPHGIGSGIYRPVFSPEGKTLAYTFNGLYLYNLSTGTNNLAVADRQLDPPPTEHYLPGSFSPSGEKLLVHITHTDTSSIAIYDVPRNTLVRFAGKTDSDFACCGIYSEFNWLLDGSALYVANPMPGVDVGGLWKVDATTGTATTLVSYGGEGNSLNFLDEPYFMPDGRLFYFYSNYNGDLGPLHRAPDDLEIVRSSPDGVAGRTTLVDNENLRMMNEALWVPDAGFVVVTLAPSEDVMDGGQLAIVYFDGRPNLVLAPFAREIKWGS